MQPWYLTDDTPEALAKRLNADSKRAAAGFKPVTPGLVTYCRRQFDADVAKIDAILNRRVAA